MAALFEVFVFEWLKAHLGSDFDLKEQEKVWVTKSGRLRFVIDILVTDRSGKPLAVLDTKYKKPSAPATEDIAQVIAYAESTACHVSLLVYCSRLTETLDAMVGDIRLHSLNFALDGDLETNGQLFKGALLERLGQGHSFSPAPA